MNLDDIKRRVDALVETVRDSDGATALQNYHSVLSVMVMFYGEGSSQLKSFIRDKDSYVEKFGGNSPRYISFLTIGALNTLKEEIDQGFTGSLEQTIAGEVLSDFIVLARHVLDRNNTDESKNVAAVLAAAAFEDTLRRLATIKQHSPY